MWTTACVDRGVLRGRDALGQGRYLEAIATLDEAVGRLAGTERPIKDLASAHRAQAGVLLSAGHCAKAAQHIARADALTQPILVDHQGLFRCMETQETPPDVRQRAMERLVELGESRGPILRELVVALLDQGREADALKVAPAARKRFALQAQDFRRLGFSFAKAGQHAEAVSYLHQYLRSNPTDPLVRLKLASALEAKGEAKAARQHYDRLKAEFPKNPVVYLRLAAFCQRQQDAYCAKDAMRTANELRGVKPDTRVLRPLPKSRR